MPLKIKRGKDRIITRDGVREPALFKLDNNDLLLSFHSEPDIHFAHRSWLRSNDNGETWKKDKSRGYREQAIGKGLNGSVLAFDIYTFEKEPGIFVGSYFLSKDGGKTFEGPLATKIRINRVCCKEYPATPEQFPADDSVLKKFYVPLPDYYKPTVKKSSYRMGFIFWRNTVEHEGRLLATMQGFFHADRAYRTVLVSSEDNGKTWNFVSTIACEDDRSIDGMCEPVLRKVADGSLLCVMRRDSGKPLAQCRSKDGGLTWSAPELLAAHGVDPDLCLMSNGVLACTFGRPGLHIMFSEDGCGYSWGYRTEIGDWPASAYMGITEISPNKLLLAYDRAANTPGAGRDPSKCYIGSTTVTVEKN
jgi:hypothetical protein